MLGVAADTRTVQPDRAVVDGEGGAVAEGEAGIDVQKAVDREVAVEGDAFQVGVTRGGENGRGVAVLEVAILDAGAAAVEAGKAAGTEHAVGAQVQDAAAQVQDAGNVDAAPAALHATQAGQGETAAQVEGAGAHGECAGVAPGGARGDGHRAAGRTQDTARTQGQVAGRQADAANGGGNHPGVAVDEAGGIDGEGLVGDTGVDAAVVGDGIGTGVVTEVAVALDGNASVDL